MDWSAVIVAVVSAALGGGIVAGISQMITAKSGAKRSEVERVILLVDELQEDNKELRQQMREVEAHYREKCDEYEIVIGELRSEIRRLYAVMRRCGIDPEAGTPLPGTNALPNMEMKL